MKPDFRIYKLETTEHWRDDIVRKAGGLFAVHIFDSNRHVHCCELTPSYEMWYLGPTWTGGEAQGSQAERDRLYGQIVEGDRDNDPVMYIHTGRVDLEKLEKREITDSRWLTLLELHDGDEEAAYTEALEEEIEYCRCNGWIY